MPGLSSVTQSLKNLYVPIAANVSAFVNKSKELSGRIYQFVLSIFQKIKERSIATLTKVCEWTLFRMGNPTEEKLRRLEADLVVKSNALSVVKAEYEALLAHGTVQPVTPIPGVPADVNKQIAFLNQELAKANSLMAAEQVKNALLRGEVQGLNNVKADLQLQQAKVGTLQNEIKKLNDEISRLNKQMKATDPLTTSGTF